MATTAKPKESSIAASGSLEKPSDWMSVTEVARYLKKRYHKARDLMLQGKVGETRYENGHLQVKSTEVRAYRAALEKRNGKP